MSTITTYYADSRVARDFLLKALTKMTNNIEDMTDEDVGDFMDVLVDPERCNFLVYSPARIEEISKRPYLDVSRVLLTPEDIEDLKPIKNETNS